jgi:shikimate kinase
MVIYLVGIACVGKTTIGRLLAQNIGYTFFDLDEEIQKYYKRPIERIQDDCLTMNDYRQKASVVLDNLLSTSTKSVIAGTPSGLKFSYYKVYKKHKAKSELYSILIKDSFENILDRLTFFDKDSNPINEELDDLKKKRYLHEIREDYIYFKESYKRADYQIDIENIRLENIPDMIIKKLNKIELMPAANNR